jgi:hypothetical protein
VYQFDVGGIRRAIQAIWHGYVSGSNDVITVQAYDYVGADWETRATITGQAGTDNIQKNISLLQKHTGSGADAGKVLLRFVCSGQSNPTLYTDGLLVEAAIASQSVGYANGAVWLDTNASNTNTTDFVDGTADNPVSTWAAAETVANSLGLTRFEIAPGSSITLDANSDNFQINAPGSTIALGGQSVSGTVIKGASVTGNDDGSNANPTAYFDCTMGSNTLGLHRLKQCGLSGTITLAESGTYDWTFCSSEVAGTGTPACDVGTAVGSTNLNIRNYSGGIEIQQLGDLGTDNVSLEGNGQLVINANCSGGTVAVRGNFRITDNSGTVNLVTTIPTINQVDNGTAQSATANSITLAATASSTDGQYDPGTVVIIAGTGEGQSRDIIDYDGTTKVATVSKDWRTNPDSTSSYVVITTSGQLHVNEGMAQGGGASTITLNTAASSTDDIYIGQTVFLVGGTGQDQSRIVTDYDGTSKVATVHKAWNTQPTSSTSYVMLPLPAIGDSIVNIETDTNELQTNQGNWLTATGFAVAGDQMTLENDAITAAKIAADAIGASELAADAVTEIQSGLSTYDGSDTSGTTTLLSRLTATRAGYLDNLSEGAVATASKLLKYVQLLFRKDAAIATDNATELTAINADGGSGAGSVDNTTDSQQGIADASGSTPPTVEQIRTEMDDNSTKLAAIVADTNELQTNQGQWLTATGFSTLDAAGVRTAIGLAAANLDTQLGKADLTAALTEAYRSTGATGSAAQLLYEILAHLGEFAITSTTKTTKKLDGSTTAKTYTLDSDTNPTSITEST